MSYLSPLVLTKLISEKQRPSAIEILSQVDKQKLLRNLRKRNALEHDFYYTDDVIERSDTNRITATDLARMDKIQQKIVKETNTAKKYLQELLAFSEKYPDYPKTFNYLCIAYRAMGQEANFLATAYAAIEKFPDYLFSKTGLCQHYLDKGQHNKIPQVLQHKMSIRQHYPSHINRFHVSEVRSFYHITGSYYAATDDITLAMASWLLIKEASPNHNAVTNLAAIIILAEIRALQRKMTKHAGRAN